MKKIILAALFLFLIAGVYGVGYSEDGSFPTFGGTRMCMSDGSVPLSGTWDFSNSTVLGITINQVNTFEGIIESVNNGEAGTVINIDSGVYNVNQTIAPKENMSISAYGAVFIRDPSMSSAGEHIIYLNSSGVTWKGGTVDMQYLGGGSSDGINGLNIYGSNVRVQDLTVKNGNGSSLIDIDGDDTKNLTNVLLDNVASINSSFAHGIRMYGAEIRIFNSLVKNAAQDGFRAYGTNTQFQIINSRAEDSRTCFSTWSDGNRNNKVTSSTAQNCETGFKATGSHSYFADITSINSSIYGLEVRGGGFSEVNGFKSYGKEGGAVVNVESDNNLFVGLFLHGDSTTPADIGLNVSGSDNLFVGVTHKNVNSYVSDSGSGNNYITKDYTNLSNIEYLQFKDAQYLAFGNSGLSDSYLSWSSSGFLRLFVSGAELFRAYNTYFQFQDDIKLLDNNYIQLGNGGTSDGTIRWTSSSNKLDFSALGNTTLRVTVEGIQLQSPDGNFWTCSPDNSGTLSCS